MLCAAYVGGVLVIAFIAWLAWIALGPEETGRPRDGDLRRVAE